MHKICTSFAFSTSNVVVIVAIMVLYVLVLYEILASSGRFTILKRFILKQYIFNANESKFHSENLQLSSLILLHWKSISLMKFTDKRLIRNSNMTDYFAKK